VKWGGLFTRLRHEERGQVLAMTAMVMIALFGMAAIVSDFGHVLYAQRELQAATDAAAMAGAQALPTMNAVNAAIQYSGMTGSLNAKPDVPNVSMVSGYPQARCLNALLALGQACLQPAGANAMDVEEQAVIPMFFAGLFGYKTMTIQAHSMASAEGGAPTPYNIAIIVDSTASMNITDNDCKATQIACALNGVQVLMQSLSPCTSLENPCTVYGGTAANPVDQIALFTFPNMSVGTMGMDSACTTPIPGNINARGFYTVAPYGNLTTPYSPTTASSSPWGGVPTATAFSFPPAVASSYSAMTVPSIIQGQTVQTTYQVTGFLSDYRTSDFATALNTNSVLVKAAGGSSGCGGMLPPNYEVDYQTFYAGSIYAAQAALVAQQSSNPGTQNVLIFLSDGDSNAEATCTQCSQVPGGSGFNYTILPGANTNGTYPSSADQCGQAVKAAQDATLAGTRVYSVAYGAEPSGCATDTVAGNYSNGLSYKSTEPCLTMANIASAPQYFYSDTNNTANNSTNNCVASQPVTSLNGIFTAIAASLSTARLIPVGTT
jgi:hypothetical protein